MLVCQPCNHVITHDQCVTSDSQTRLSYINAQQFLRILYAQSMHLTLRVVLTLLPHTTKNNI